MTQALTENSFKLAEYDWPVFNILPEPGTAIEEVLKPEYWVNISRRLVQGTRIEVRPKDGAYFAQVYVASLDKSGLVPLVRIVLLTYHDLNLDPTKTAPTKESETYKVVWRGEKAKHTVTVVASNEIIKDGFPSKKDAEDWIEQKELGLLTE